MRALASGERVEWSDVDFNGWRIVDGDTRVGIFDDNYTFRIKPKTIKLEFEIPPPFEPKIGEEVWFISDDHGCGYSRYEHGEHSTYVFGCWRTEEEIKQVVAALRSIKK